MNLSEKEKQLILEQMNDIKASISRNNDVRESHVENLRAAEETDKIYKKIWFNYNRYISQYEKEIESMIGEAISVPVKEQDLIDLANNHGRLYQGLISTDAKPIVEFTGGGLSSKEIRPNEKTDLSPELDEIARVLIEGKESFTFTPAELLESYIPGSGQVVTSGEILENHWYLVGGDALVYITTVIYQPFQPEQPAYCQGASGSNQIECEGNGGIWHPAVPEVPESWTGTISEVYEDGIASIGELLSSWGGYNNTERTDKVATSTTQRLMNVLIVKLEDEIEPWYIALKKSYTAVINNAAPNMNLASKSVTIRDYDYLSDYIEVLPIQDGPNGIGGLVDRISSRKAFIDPRVMQCRDDKGEYYGNRYNFTNLRSNIQSGTLTEVIFTSKLLEQFPSGGTSEQKRSFGLLKSLLN